MVFKEIVDAENKMGIDLAPMDKLPPQGGHHFAAQTPNNPVCRKRLCEPREAVRRRMRTRLVRAQHARSSPTLNS
jgi:hypothetical protein